jgi:hypothetical protein
MAKRRNNNSNNNTLMVCLLLFVVVIILILVFKGSGGFCGGQEKFGQEPSMRAASGWIAGPGGGNKYIHPKNRNSRESFNKKESQSDCKSCMSTEDFE